MYEFWLDTNIQTWQSAPDSPNSCPFMHASYIHSVPEVLKLVNLLQHQLQNLQNYTATSSKSDMGETRDTIYPEGNCFPAVNL